jgi:hypothetical protein
MHRTAEEPPAIIPELKIVKLTYDIHVRYNVHPEVDEYLVSIGRKTKQVNTIYQVVHAREICRRLKHGRAVSNYRRWLLQVVKVPEMRPYVKHNQVLETVTVNDQDAWPIYWYSRDKKKR